MEENQVKKLQHEGGKTISRKEERGPHPQRKRHLIKRKGRSGRRSSRI